MQETKVKDVEWKEWEQKSSQLSKKDLIDFILKKSGRSKRELEKKVAIEKRESVVADTYISFLSSILPTSFVKEEGPEKERHQKGMKHFNANEGRRKQIKILKDEIKQMKKKLDDVRKPQQECRNKKKEAQNNITQKSVKNMYKYFEKNSDPVPVALFEVFVGCLRGTDKASREDVELYLKKHKGLITSMNKLQEKDINREYAKHYAEVLKKIKEPILEKEYTRFIPYYVWMDNVVRVIKYSIEEKHLQEELQQKEDQIFKLEHEIDRGQIVLDHLGIDPNEHSHLSNLLHFWKKHVSDLNVHVNKDETKLKEWENEHFEETHRKSQKHPDDEEKKVNMKREYPIMGKTDEEKGDKAKAAVLDSEEESEGTDEDEDDQGADEEDDDETPDTSEQHSNMV